MNTRTCISRKAFVSITASMLLAACLPLDAHGFSAKGNSDQEGHDKILERILFGVKGPSVKTDTGRRQAITAINYASHLCIDQFGDSGDGKHDFLAGKFGVPSLPTFDEIQLLGVSGHNHRESTHMGWHYAYSGKTQDRWVKRKELLLKTINKIFDFGLFDDARHMLYWYDGSDCDAFAELVYCVHLLGDYQEGIEQAIKDKSYSLKKTVTEQCIPYAFKDASENNRDLLYDLCDALERLFADGETKHDYSKLIRRLNRQVKRARRLKTVKNEKMALGFQESIMDVRGLLEDYVPKLLEDTEFFSRVFYA